MDAKRACNLAWNVLQMVARKISRNPVVLFVGEAARLKVKQRLDAQAPDTYINQVLWGDENENDKRGRG